MIVMGDFFKKLEKYKTAEQLMYKEYHKPSFYINDENDPFIHLEEYSPKFLTVYEDFVNAKFNLACVMFKISKDSNSAKVDVSKEKTKNDHVVQVNRHLLEEVDILNSDEAKYNSSNYITGDSETTSTPNNSTTDLLPLTIKTEKLNVADIDFLRFS